MALIVLLLILLGLGLYVMMTYNKLVALIEACRNNKKQIDVQLDRRFKVFESLIEVVKKYMDYEQTTLKDVVALRSRATQAAAQGDEHARMASENEISKIAGSINLLFEQYPDLKANQNAMQLQEEIVSTENKLAFSKQAYNDSVERFVATRESFVEQLVVQFFAKLNQQFEYWGLNEEQIKENENYKVKF